MNQFDASFIPEIRILFSDLLYFGESQSLAKVNNKKIEISYDECLAKTKEYNEAWKKHSEKILVEMQKLYQLNFHKPVIDAFLAPMFIPKSMPLIINLRHTADQFVDVLTHELFHNLFTDNQYIKKQELAKSRIGYIWEDIFGKRDFVELVHIPVHAGLKAVYLDVLKQPYRLERDIQDCSSRPGYKEAWDFVENNDYQKINKEIAVLYKKNFK